MSQVEDAYRAAVDAMTPAEKFARMHVLLHWARDLYARQLRAELRNGSAGKSPCVSTARIAGRGN
jgi:hypothetical protein